MKSVLIVIFVFFVSGLFGQVQVFPLMPKYYQPLDSTVLKKNNTEETKSNATLLKQYEKFSHSVTIGTGFSSFGNEMSMMSSYIAPAFTYNVNSKLNISVNGIIMQNNLSGVEGTFGATPGGGYNSSISNYGISGMAYYQLSDNWSIWGNGTYYENQSVFTDYRAETYDTDYKSISFGVGYKVNDKVHLHFQYRYSNGLNPIYNFGSPYYNSSVYPRRTGFDMWDF
ncbi:MAG: hypothetical protein KOO66_03230 [Bacteroidales bacterium]|nr:hypothetical protein [Bacteroidales bacterium]